jgi:hypothetical protein
MKIITNTLLFLSLITTSIFAQKQQSFNLFDLQNQGKLTVINRKIEAVEEQGNKFVRLSEGSKEGVIWLPVKNFQNGILEIEMRGKDILQRSFIGLIFHGQNDSTYDAVYCRPFNFFAKDSVRKIHAVQYISHPNFTWKKLRETRNGEFEKEIISPPDPNGWFTMKIVIENKSVKAYINQDAKPSLSVEKLTNTQNGKVGIFVGDGSGGDFRNVKVSYIN